MGTVTSSAATFSGNVMILSGSMVRSQSRDIHISTVASTVDRSVNVDLTVGADMSSAGSQHFCFGRRASCTSWSGGKWDLITWFGVVDDSGLTWCLNHQQFGSTDQA